MSKEPGNNNLNNESNNFGLPDGYFQKSAGSIFNKIEWLEEHRQYERLIGLKKESSFTLPKSYFEKSGAKLELAPYPYLLALQKAAGFIVPQHYFEELEVNELAKILTAEKNELQTLGKLNSIDRLNPFIVGETYFSNTGQKIIASVNRPVKVIRLFGTKTWYSAAAAVVALTLGLWIYNNYFKPVVSKDCGTLACVDKTDLVKTKNLENLDDEQLYEIVDTKKLEEKLESKPARKDKKDTDTSLKNISTEELLDEI